LTSGIGILLIIAFLCLLGSKLINLINKGEKHSIVRSLFECGIGFLLFLFLSINQLSIIQASTEQPFYIGDVFEVTQYVSLVSLLFPLLIIFTFVEILMHFKIFVSRGRLNVIE